MHCEQGGIFVGIFVVFVRPDTAIGEKENLRYTCVIIDISRCKAKVKYGIRNAF